MQRAISKTSRRLDDLERWLECNWDNEEAVAYLNKKG